MKKFLAWYARIPDFLEVGIVTFLILLQTWVVLKRSALPGVLAFAMIMLSWIAKKNTPARLGLVYPRIAIPILTAAFAIFLVIKTTQGINQHFKGLHGWQKFLADLAVYLPWGIVQKLIENGFIFQRMLDIHLRERWAMLGCAVLVFFLHVPNPVLMPVVVLGSLAGNWAFLKWRNIYAIGAAHGLVGAILLHVFPVNIARHLVVGISYFSYHPK